MRGRGKLGKKEERLWVKKRVERQRETENERSGWSKTETEKEKLAMYEHTIYCTVNKGPAYKLHEVLLFFAGLEFVQFIWISLSLSRSVTRTPT